MCWSSFRACIWKLQQRATSHEHQGWVALLAEQVVIIRSLMAVTKQQPQHHARAKQAQCSHFTGKHVGNSGEVHEDSVSGVELPLDSYLATLINECP